MNDDAFLVRDGDDVHFLTLQFLLVHGPLTHTDADLVI